MFWLKTYSILLFPFGLDCQVAINILSLIDSGVSQQGLATMMTSSSRNSASKTGLLLGGPTHSKSESLQVCFPAAWSPFITSSSDLRMKQYMADKDITSRFLFYPRVVACNHFASGLPAGGLMTLFLSKHVGRNWTLFSWRTELAILITLFLGDSVSHNFSSWKCFGPSSGAARDNPIPQDYRDHIAKYIPTLRSFNLERAADHLQAWIDGNLSLAPLLDVAGSFGLSWVFLKTYVMAAWTYIFNVWILNCPKLASHDYKTTIFVHFMAEIVDGIPLKGPKP